jgi:biopolymer transport protein ExbB
MRKFIALFMLAGILFVPVFANAQDALVASASTPTAVDDEIVAELPPSN